MAKSIIRFGINVMDSVSIVRRIKGGRYNVGNLTYVYCKNKEEQIIIDTTGEVIRFIYNEYLTGNGA